MRLTGEDVEVRLSLKEGVPAVRVDPIQLEQAAPVWERKMSFPLGTSFPSWRSDCVAISYTGFRRICSG